MRNIKNSKFSLYNVNTEYLDYLRKYDAKIPQEHRGTSVNLRPFAGIVIMMNDINYLLPLTSPKPKHIKMKNDIDFHKIDGGIYGAINFNNMFPVIDDIRILNEISLRIDPASTVQKREYINLLINQITWLNHTTNKKIILEKAIHLRDQYLSSSLSDTVKNRCCNFKILESKYTLFKPINKPLILTS